MCLSCFCYYVSLFLVFSCLLLRCYLQLFDCGCGLRLDRKRARGWGLERARKGKGTNLAQYFAISFVLHILRWVWRIQRLVDWKEGYLLDSLLTCDSEGVSKIPICFRDTIQHFC